VLALLFLPHAPLLRIRLWCGLCVVGLRVVDLFFFLFCFFSLVYGTLCVELLLQQLDTKRLLLLLPRAPLLLTLVTSVSLLLYQYSK
jgi:hypothetical protein